MSIMASNWAYAQPVKGPAKAVLCALAFRANGKTGLCNPSIGTIAKDAGLGKTAVKKGIRTLVAAGLITIVNRTAAGCKLANQYILNCNETQAESRGDQGGGSRADVGHEATEGRSPDGHKHRREHQDPSQDKTEVEVEHYPRRLRVVGGRDEPNPFHDGEGR